MAQLKKNFFSFPIIVALVLIGVFFIDDWWGEKRFIYESNIDNRDIILPLHLYFIDEIQQGRVPYLLPYIWSGTRLIGDPNFQMSPVHLVAVFILSKHHYMDFLSIWSVLIVCGGFLGAYRLIGALIPERSAWLVCVSALLYVFSTGFFFARQFTNTEFIFLAIPWVWYLIYTNRPESALRNTVFIVVILWIQFSYGQLQFSIYTAWLMLLFGLFVPDKKYRRLNIYTILISGVSAVILASYYLLPTFDNLITHGGMDSGRLFDSAPLKNQVVEPYYLLRLFFPSIFGWSYPETGVMSNVAYLLGISTYQKIPWWPVWKDGWSYWESFTAFQGSMVTIVVIFGIMFLKGSWFWRAGYIGLILLVTTYIGALLLYIIHLGVNVPYGRITVLLGLFSVVIFIKTLYLILDTRRMQIQFTIYLWALSLITLMLTQTGLPKWIVQRMFIHASKEIGGFYEQYVDVFMIAIRNHGIFIFGSAVLVTLCVVWIYIFDRKRNVLIAKGILVTGIVCLALSDAILYYSGGGLSKEETLKARSLAQGPNNIETALAQDGADFSRYRLHLDMPFQAYRNAAYRDATQADTSRPSLIAQQWIPNRTISGRYAITGGYSSVIPGGARYMELLYWRPGASDLRAQGEYSVLHPALFDIFSIRYLLRLKSEPMRDLEWRQIVLGPWENVFRQKARLLYEDDTYELFKYEKAPSLFYFPKRIVYSDSLVKDVLALTHVVEHFVDPWETTGFLPRSKFSNPEGQNLPDVIIQKQSTQRELQATHNQDRTWSIKIRTQDPAFLFTGLRYDPWWKVTIDGKGVAPILSNGVFMAIPVPAGDHYVVFKIRPMSVWIGFVITLIGLCAGLLYLLGNAEFLRRRKCR